MYFRKFYSVQLRLLAISMIVVLGTSLHAQTGGKIIYDFNGEPAANPTSGLIADAAGNLYGVTFDDVFELSPAVGGGWSFNIVYEFTGDQLTGNPLWDNSGNLYVTAGTGTGDGHCGAVYELTPGVGGTWTANTVFAFPSSGMSGCGAMDGVVMDNAGNLYGTTRGGPYDEGVVFELTLANGVWTEDVLYGFEGQTVPTTPVSIDAAGNLYVGNGTDIFQISPIAGGGWSVNSIYRFGRNDGANPIGKLTFDAAGNLYGTNQAGGYYRAGTAFQLKPGGGAAWTYTVLHAFGGMINGKADGIFPQSGLAFDAAGNPWGTTIGGGTFGVGTVFKLTPEGGRWAETAFHSFTGKQGGATPGGLLLLYQGNFYGVTAQGGIHGNGGRDGLAFEFTP